MSDHKEYTDILAKGAKQAARELALLSAEVKDTLLRSIASEVRAGSAQIIAGNKKDLDAGKEAGLTPALLDRLLLDEKRIEGIAAGVEQIVTLPDPVGTVLSETEPVKNLKVRKIRCPIGVVAIIYESRPNVTIDTAALCLKSGNAVILRGGKEAAFSNLALAQCVQRALEKHGVPESAVQLVSRADREIVSHLVTAEGLIDVVIPRGGEGLIRAVSSQATIPVLKHYKGICHLYVDKDADLEWAFQIAMNAKCQRPGVCNAAETFLVHQSVAPELLPRLGKALEEHGVEIRADQGSQKHLESAKDATEEDWHTEYLDLVISIKTVASLEEAIEHINHYGSHHSDAIVSSNVESASTFEKQVDSAAIHINASTRFTDGGMFGLGAEMGISTDKLHARGPMGLEELTTYKWVTHGLGSIR